MLWIGEWSHNELFIPRKDFRAVRVTEQVEASTVKLSLDQNSLAGLKGCLPIKNFSSCIVYRPECHSAIRAVYKSNRMVGFIGMKFQFNFQVLTNSITFVQKVCFAFGKKDQKNTQYLLKENCRY